MRYFRCKCGEHAAWSSMGVAECDGCEKCNTTLAESPNGHGEIAPHDWREEFTVDAKTGARSIERACMRCMKREPVVFTIRVDGRDVAIKAVDVTLGQIKAMAMVDPIFNLWRGAPGASLPLAEDQSIQLADGMEFTSAPQGTF